MRVISAPEGATNIRFVWSGATRAQMRLTKRDDGSEVAVMKGAAGRFAKDGGGTVDLEPGNYVLDVPLSDDPLDDDLTIEVDEAKAPRKVSVRG